MEYELLDTGVFNKDRYFDVFVEYAKDAPTDIVVKIVACNRGPEAAKLDVLPTTWFRNIWTWGPDPQKPILKQMEGGYGPVVSLTHPDSGQFWLYCEGDVPLLFTENETNNQRIFGAPNASRYVKDSINDFVVNAKQDTVNRGKLDLVAEAFNLFNHPNIAQLNPVFGQGTVALPSFLEPLTGLGGRRLQFSLDFEF